MRNGLTVTCVHPEDGKGAQALLLESFQLFLRREVEAVAKRGGHAV